MKSVGLQRKIQDSIREFKETINSMIHKNLELEFKEFDKSWDKNNKIIFERKKRWTKKLTNYRSYLTA